MSSRVSSGKSRMISTADIPDARDSSTSETVMRIPRMHGFPPRLPGSMLMARPPVAAGEPARGAPAKARASS